MSLQPLPLSDKPITNHPAWQDICRLAEVLWIQSSIGGLLCYLADESWRLLSRQTGVELANPFLDQVRDEEIRYHAILINQPSTTINQAIQEKQITAGYLKLCRTD